jgi:hypothetical protein
MRILTFTAAYSKAFGPEMIIRVLRVVPSTSDAFLYACNGNIEGMKYLLNNGMASPMDVEHGTGFSLLAVSNIKGVCVVMNVNFLTSEGRGPSTY